MQWMLQLVTKFYYTEISEILWKIWKSAFTETKEYVKGLLNTLQELKLGEIY